MIKKWLSLKEFVLINVGVLLMVCGIYFFKFPNHFSIGGVTGLSIVLTGIFPQFKPGALVFFLNMLLLVIGFLFFGKGFGLKTAYASTVFSIEIWLFEVLFPMSAPFTDQPLLELMYAVMLPAFGSALLFNNAASSGGTDVVAMILKKHTHLDIGKALLCSDLLITLSAGFVFGIKVGLFSVLGLAAKALVVDTVIENINLNKYFTIITAKPELISDYIVKTLKRGATIQDARGAFSHQPKSVIIAVVSRPQAIRLQRYIREADPEAFLMITNTSEIIGKGFRGMP